VEIDPETLEFVTYVGANDEWLQGAPGLLEPLCAVAAHPAPDVDEGALWFVNYTQLAPPGAPKETWIGRWGLDGPVRRWRVEGMSPFDSIHDIKATEHHLVFADLPFVVEPGSFTGKPRTLRNQEHTNLWIVAKDDLRATEPGGAVRALEVQLPDAHRPPLRRPRRGRRQAARGAPAGPLSDLMITVAAGDLEHRGGTAIDGEYEGLIALAMQPSVVGRYEIDVATGEVVDAEVACDPERAWGGMLPTTDTSSPRPGPASASSGTPGGLRPRPRAPDVVGPLRRCHRRGGGARPSCPTIRSRATWRGSTSSR
jgi:hypothetical protein